MISIHGAGPDEPRFSLAQPRKTAQKLARRRSDDRPHLGREILWCAHLQGGHGVEELAAEPLRVGDGADEDDEGSSGALLARVTEGGGGNVLRREVEIGVRR